MSAAAERAGCIARLNDRARQAMGTACIVVATEGFRALPGVDQNRVRELIETYDAFDEGNDPYGEYDFGAVFQRADGQWATEREENAGDERERVFWKIDYFDRTLEFGSDNPADPRMTQRVLTIMHASEY